MNGRNKMIVTVDPKDWLAQNLEILTELIRGTGLSAEWHGNSLIIPGIPADRIYDVVHILKRFNKDRAFWDLDLNGTGFLLPW